MTENKPLGITDVVLRDAHQSLLATRMRIDDMLPIASKLDEVGYWSLETWGGATFDACIRYLGEDPWERLRLLKQAMPKTPQQMLLRGQNLLGYRHYADDVVDKFVERAAINGIDVFRIFDALNDVRNLTRAIQATINVGKHAQGTISYTVSPVHTLELWVDLAKQIEDNGAHSLCIKDMAGLLRPYLAFELVSRLKQSLAIPIHMQCHATTGMSTATCIKAAEAGIDNIDTSISSMSMTYGHSPTESLVAILADTPRATGLNMSALEEIAAYFRVVRKKYAAFEGSLRGVDSRILVSQVPGGMLTNLENQLKEQQASDKFDAVLAEIPVVREELGFLPLVTPTSQIVGTQAVINVVTGKRYQNVTKETAGILKGEYGCTPAPVNKALQQRVLGDEQPISCRPADLLDSEIDALSAEFADIVAERSIQQAVDVIDDILTYALFDQTALKFLANRYDASVFEPAPTERLSEALPKKSTDSANMGATGAQGNYQVSVDGHTYQVQVDPAGDNATIMNSTDETAPETSREIVSAGLAGTIFNLMVKPGDIVETGQVLIILEAMKMETEVVAANPGTIDQLFVTLGDEVAVGDTLLSYR